MARFLKYAAVVTLIAVGLYLGIPIVKDAIGKRKIAAVFEGYQQAVLEYRGQDAYQMVDDRTTDYYDQLAEIVSGRVVWNEELIVPAQIATMLARKTVSEENLASMNGQQLFVYLVDNGWLHRELLAHCSIKGVNYYDIAATAYLEHHPGAPEPRLKQWRFEVQEGEWKVDLEVNLDDEDEIYRIIAASNGLDLSIFLDNLTDGMIADLRQPYPAADGRAQEA